MELEYNYNIYLFCGNNVYKTESLIWAPHHIFLNEISNTSNSKYAKRINYDKTLKKCY